MVVTPAIIVGLVVTAIPGPAIILSDSSPSAFKVSCPSTNHGLNVDPKSTNTSPPPLSVILNPLLLSKIIVFTSSTALFASAPPLPRVFLTVKADPPPPPSKNTVAIPVVVSNVDVDTPAPFNTREDAFPTEPPSVEIPIVLLPC